MSVLRSGHTFGDGQRGLRQVLLRIQKLEQERIESPQPDTLELSTGSAPPSGV